MPFGENGCQVDEETRKRFAEIFGGAPKREHALGQDLEDVRMRLERELDEMRRDAPDGLEGLSVGRADVLRRAYTEKYV